MKRRAKARLEPESSPTELEGFSSAIKRWGNKPMQRKQCRSRVKPFIAYDLETTRIAEGTPRVLYLTAYGENYKLSLPIKGRDRIEYLSEILLEEMLVKRFNGFRFIAWNGNGFDVFFIAQALLRLDDIIIRPYLTRSKAIRGMKAIGINKLEGMEWEFLDGMSMTGLDTVKMKLSKFVGLFAPQYPKLELDFSSVEFDARNKEHVAYAERDAEALFHAMKRASEIVRGLTGNELQPTMGNLAIKYFQSRMPEGVRVWKPNEELRGVLHGQAKRGGYCWISKQYVGPIWKYDLNQAYAAAMRDAELPCGSCVKVEKYMPRKPGVYRVTIERETLSRVPFYYRDEATNAGRFTNGALAETWLLSTEIEHLKRDEWAVKIHHGYYWSQSFNMREMVDELERLRFTDPDGPSGALGTMVKVTGNSAYGKTLEQLGGIELVMSKVKPEGYSPYEPENPELANIYFKSDEAPPRVYHQPQIGCFTTAHVRIVVREAALQAPGHFIYADTDCVAFSKPVDFLTINATHYGDWKCETAGEEYIFIGKKVYYGMEADGSQTRHAKGLMIRDLTKEDFQKWFAGKPPSQKQLQRKNFVKFIGGADMFASQERTGTDVRKSKQVILSQGEFSPR